MNRKAVPGYESRYEIDDGGIVYSKKTGTKMAVFLTKQGYQRAHFKVGGKLKKHLVHRLVWAAFKGDVPHGYNVHHVNENKADNRLENLALMPHAAHSRFHNLGEKANGARLDQKAVLEIRSLAKSSSLSDGEIAKQFGVTRRHVSGIVTGRQWAHIGGYVRTKKESKQNRRKFSDEEVRKIRRAWAAKKRGVQRALAREYGVTHSTIQQIINGASYADVR